MKNVKLKVEKETKEANEIELSVEAPKEVSQKAYTIAFRDIASSMDVSGFRKGKAPKDVIEKTVGKGYISQKAFEKVFYDLIVDVSKQEKLDIVDVIQVQSFELVPEKPLTFKALVELKPEVKLGTYKGLKVKAKKMVYDKQEFIDKTLGRLKENLISLQKVKDRNIKEGDVLTLDFEGKFEDGSEVPGGRAENHQAVLEKGAFLPEFVDALVGAKEGDTKEVEITLPKETPGDMAGKKATFTFSIKGVEEKVLPEADDEMAKKLGLKDYAELESKILEEMVHVQETGSKGDFETKLVDEIVKESKFEVSKNMIQKEIDFLLQDIRQKCQHEGKDWEEFKADKANKELFEKADESAKKRISIDLVLGAIIKKENIEVPEEEVNIEVAKKVAQMGEQYVHLQKDKRFKSSVEQTVLRNKAVDYLIQNNEADWEEEKVKVDK